MMDLAILKHDLSIRRVADIGKSDLEIIGVQLLEQMEARDGSPHVNVRGDGERARAIEALVRAL
jgi:hypothetical protein